MCHGLASEPRGAVFVPDLLRRECYQVEPDYEKGEFQGSGGLVSMIDESVLLLKEPSGLQAEEGALAGYSSAVKKFEECEDVDSIATATWIDCIKDGASFDAVEPKLSPREGAPLEPELSSHEEVSKAPKCRKARKSEAVNEHSHAQHDSEMDDGALPLIDEKRKRRMSSNRLSAQRSRQRKQDRLDELEILTAQLRLENATLTRKSKMAEQLARRIQTEKNELAKQVEELRKDLDATRHAHAHPRTHGSSASGDEISETCGNLNSGVCDNMVEDGETSPALEVQMPCKSTTASMKRIISSGDLSSGLFQELFDAFESDEFDVTLGGAVSDSLQQEWYGSFTDCLNDHA